VISHLGEAYPKFLFPQPQRSVLPRQLQPTSSRQAEFVICDQTIEHIIRDQEDYESIRAYIRTNPRRWVEDQLHPAAAPNPFNQE
jgi:hypothetical protein